MKKNLLLLFALLLAIISCEKDNKLIDKEKGKEVYIKSVSLDRKELTLKSGESYQFKVTYAPVDTGIRFDSWYIDNYKPVSGKSDFRPTINNGLLLSEESCTLDVIYVAEIDGGISFSDTCKVKYVFSEKEIHRKYCYGYSVKDTTGILSGEFTIFRPDEHLRDTTYLIGFKKDKIWIGTFNEKTKEQIDNWIDTEPTSKTQKVHTSYGEYHQFTINEARVKSFIRNGDDVALCLGLTDSDDWQTREYRLLHFRINGKVKKYYYTGFDYEPIKKWYENSYLINIDVSQEPYDALDKFYTCFSESGEVLASGKVYYGLKEEWIPTNFDEFIYIGQVSENAWTTDLHISKMSLKQEYSIWYHTLGIKIAHDDRYRMSVAKKNGDIWTLNVKITPRTGREYTLVYELNIKDGKAVKQNN